MQKIRKILRAVFWQNSKKGFFGQKLPSGACPKNTFWAISREKIKFLTCGFRELLDNDWGYIMSRFQKNPMTSFQENMKKPHFWAFLGTFGQFGAKLDVSREIGLCHFLYFIILHLHAKN